MNILQELNNDTKTFHLQLKRVDREWKYYLQRCELLSGYLLLYRLIEGKCQLWIPVHFEWSGKRWSLFSKNRPQLVLPDHSKIAWKKDMKFAWPFFDYDAYWRAYHSFYLL